MAPTGTSALNPGIGPRPIVGRVSASEVQAAPAGQAVQAPHASALRGKEIRVGDGQERNNTVSLGQKARGFFAKALKGFAFVVGIPVAGSILIGLGVTVIAIKSINLIGRLANKKIFEPRAERKYRQANADVVKALETPRPGSVLNKEGVRGKLSIHRDNCATPVSDKEIAAMVTMGENIAAALQQGDGSLPLIFDGKEVTSNTYTTRALAWYMMALAARQDLDRLDAGQQGTSDMVTAGSMLMKDPGGAMHRFMSSAPTASSRMSTHFAERTGHDEKHKTLGLIPTGKPRQRGIEDYAGKLPGEGGAILFDKLKDDVLFVKIEPCGCPPYFQQEPGQGAVGPAAGISRFFHALDRNIDHSLSFVHTRLAGPDENQVVRQEHLHKGTLKATVDKEFNALVETAIAGGIIEGDAKAIGKSAHKFGMSYVTAAIKQIREAAAHHAVSGGDEALAARCVNLMNQCDEVLQLTRDETQRAGIVEGIERRGFETHLAIPDFGPGVEGISMQPPEMSFEASEAFDTLSSALEILQRPGTQPDEIGVAIVNAAAGVSVYRAAGLRHSEVEAVLRDVNTLLRGILAPLPAVERAELWPFFNPPRA